MPLTINVGLSRKASRDFQSTGVSINVTAELDQSLLARPDDLQAQMADLYAQAEAALDRAARPAESRRNDYEHQRPSRGPSRPAHDADHGGNGNNRRPGSANCNGNGHGRNGGNGGSMTQSQRRAILAIAKRANVDVDSECRDVVGDALDNLTLRQASELIDHLKGIEPAGNGR